MHKIFLWCECSYTALGVTALLEHKFDISLGNDLRDLNDARDSDWYIFVISSSNIFDMATLIRKRGELRENSKVLLLSEGKLIKSLGFLCGQEIKSMSMSQFYLSYNSLIDDSSYLNPDSNEKTQDKVTPTELAVMRLIMKGDTVSEVASRLNRSVKTISLQKISFLKRIGVKNRIASLYRYFYAY
ncbi:MULTISPECIES: LuxR C-terminal-related transcriptional regulator [unclassified Serratia (in: enterobacteria)]|uniref:LuxR C-terminal-related transcriptional regulator n=1 Tax=unclassified Serratia (in: enterobacteria) TaxID=2647522 RepID=UPI0005011F5E|nr:MULTISPECIES: LuxR C-terminal-related transcriptional regulator [unclassified Serratia (in: enterobacteria)]KFK95639.1 hypothetical protein JV45_07740 [Serratia sp. Ag2]KFL00347.1 hypothetical protein IV04_02580 [Serratia sp. Ag1]